MRVIIKTAILSVFALSVLFTRSVSMAAVAKTDRLVLELAINHVDITTDFTGDYLTVFGMVNLQKKQNSENGTSLLAIVFKGPDRKVVVRRKENIYGMWINGSSFEFLDVPSYYDYAVSNLGYKNFGEDNYNIGLNSIDFTATEADETGDVSIFKEALIANRITKGLYSVSEGKIDFINGGLFKTGFKIPPSVPAGTYQVTAYLFENGDLVEREQASLKIAQTGFAADLYNFAYDHALLYGIFSVLVAIWAGLVTNLIFRKD